MVPVVMPVSVCQPEGARGRKCRSQCDSRKFHDWTSLGFNRQQSSMFAEVPRSVKKQTISAWQVRVFAGRQSGMARRNFGLEFGGCVFMNEMIDQPLC
jgi:hypothetical protein